MLLFFLVGSISTFDTGSNEDDDLLVVVSTSQLETASIASNTNETGMLLAAGEDTTPQLALTDIKSSTQDSYVESALLRDERIGLMMQEYEDQFTDVDRIK